jgi:outer membrane immunogenic protein
MGDIMSKTIFAAVAAASILGAAPAPAADLPPVPARYPAPIVQAPAFNWTGFYIGGNAGYGFAQWTTDVSLNGASQRIDAENLKGAIAGGQAGYNWQTGPLVLGVEADLQWSGQKSTATVGILTATDRISSFATLRGRVGYAADRVLFYGTGGWAAGTWRSELTVAGLGTASYPVSRGGWTAGAGIEAALGAGFTAKVEYLFLEGGRNVDSASLPGVTFTSRTRDSVVRIGVNYLFSAGPTIGRN